MRTNKFGGQIKTVDDVLGEAIKRRRCLGGLYTIMTASYRRQLDVEVQGRKLEQEILVLVSPTGPHRGNPEAAASAIAGRLYNRY